ncbi:MAG: FAD-dependent oxidoreductase [Pseudomonadales bacterium]
MPETANAPAYDLAIIGGGIYGALTLLHAVNRGWRCCLIERDKLGSATTANNFRTLHGGLRSLQAADLPRFFEGVSQRRWFLQHFPERTSIKRFVLPLSGRSIYRPWLMRLAGLLNDSLSLHRNQGVHESHLIPKTHLLSRAELTATTPELSMADAVGAFCWYDGQVDDLPGLMADVLQLSRSSPGSADVFEDSNVIAIDTVNQGYELTYHAAEVAQQPTSNPLTPQSVHAQRVVDTSGLWPAPWKAGLGFSPRYAPSLAWNVIFERPAIGNDAIAFRTSQGQIVFLRPWDGRIYAGTGHAPSTEPFSDMSDIRKQILPHIPKFVGELARASGLALSMDEVASVQCGVLPVNSTGSTQLATRPAFSVDDKGTALHVTGVKFTTAPGVTAQTIQRLARA